MRPYQKCYARVRLLRCREAGSSCESARRCPTQSASRSRSRRSLDDHHLAAVFREAEYHADHVRYNRPDYAYARR
jgi:hypothetical protein